MHEIPLKYVASFHRHLLHKLGTLPTHLLNAHYLSFVVTMGSGRLAGGLLEGLELVLII